MPIQPKFVRHYLPPKDHLAAIGSIAVIWTAIESIMETTLLGLYEIDIGRGLVLTANLSFHARMSLLRILTGESVHMDPAQAEEMNVILTRIDAGFGDRNAIIHGLWGPGDEPGIARRLSVRARGKKLQAISQNYKAQHLWAISDRLAVLLKDFADLGHRLGIEERLAAAPRHSLGERPPRKNTSK
jgi:hypothetical protein